MCLNSNSWTQVAVLPLVEGDSTRSVKTSHLSMFTSSRKYEAFLRATLGELLSPPRAPTTAPTTTTSHASEARFPMALSHLLLLSSSYLLFSLVQRQHERFDLHFLGILCNFFYVSQGSKYFLMYICKTKKILICDFATFQLQHCFRITLLWRISEKHEKIRKKLLKCNVLLLSCKHEYTNLAFMPKITFLH